MNKIQFLECLDELLELAPGTVAGGDDLEQHGWGSVAAIGFLALADEKFGEVPSPEQLAKCRTADDLEALFPGRIAA
jgi:hypothetical protein